MITYKLDIEYVTREFGSNSERRRVPGHARQQQRAGAHVTHLYHVAPGPAPAQYDKTKSVIIIK